MAKSHPAFDLLDRYFQQNVMQGAPAPAQGGSADAAVVDEGEAQQLAFEQAKNEVAKDSALMMLMAKAMGLDRVLKKQATSGGNPGAV